MPSVVVYTEDGRESINSAKRPMLASIKKLVYPTNTTINVRAFPITTESYYTNPISVAKVCKQPYAGYAEEHKGIVFIKPNNRNNGIVCYGVYSNTPVNTNYSIVDLGANNNYNLDMVMADIDVVPRDRGYINMYADDPASTLMWSLETMTCGINVIKVIPLSQPYITELIPTWVNLDKLYVSVPHNNIYNRDNGTDPDWDVSDMNYQLIGNTMHIRNRRISGYGPLNPYPGGFIVLAEITNALNYQTI